MAQGQEFIHTDMKAMASTLAETTDGNISEPESFTCAICIENITDADPILVPKTADGDALCQACFRAGVWPLFEKALESEQYYPPRWGRDVVLNPRDYPAFARPHFRLAYETKELEYKLPVRDRV